MWEDIMATATFYERRQLQKSVSTENREIKKRRLLAGDYFPERRRLISQSRQYLRESFDIPVSLKMGTEEFSGKTAQTKVLTWVETR